MKFTKIKRTGGRVEVIFTEPNGDDDIESSFKSHDKPRKAFEEALQNLKGDLLHTLELSTSQKFQEKVTVTGVSIDEKDDVRGFIITAKVKVGAGTYAISTPRMKEPIEEAVGDTVLKPIQVKRIEQVIDEARAYLNPENRESQTELEMQDEDAEAEAVEA